MKKLFTKTVFIVWLILLLGFCATVYCVAGDSGYLKDLPEGVYLDIDRDFYEALNSERVKTYSNDKSAEYLRQIAVSSKFTVETNLRIIRQQEKIIGLLEKIADNKGK